jgi:hypothetical protein
MDEDQLFLADMRANLTDDLFWEMSANPDKLLPYAVFWPRVTRELSDH